MKSGKVFGKLVCDRRTALGLTQQQVGSKIDLAQSYMSDIEMGRRPIKVNKIPTLAKALEMDEAELQAALRCDNAADPIEGAEVTVEDLAFLKDTAQQLGGRISYGTVIDLLLQRIRHRTS